MYRISENDDLGKVILSLGIGEAIVTVMNERVADVGCLDPVAGPGVPDGTGRSQGHGTGGEGLAAVREVRRVGWHRELVR